ncbi:MAG: GNAT family N-acetyltransferase [Novosphingobium sp.]|nr:GNAT family N-acetyltransferase [Novosphingobium sp.]
MTDVNITLRDEGGHGVYTAQVEGSDASGRLTWVERDGVRVAEHTIVPPEIGGRGIAAQLVEALVADAREHSFKVRPACSYVAAKFDKRPDWAELLA